MILASPAHCSGGPNRTVILARPGSPPVPASATGTTGAPAVSASHATPVRPRYRRPSRDLVPSG
ncbi:hypothetical protein GCM10010532_111910 [Dactylosporangium siamense]|uniref:Uncharacterized protein n=1 Tax=Dactylosporangium siamense TaxID=685454 RepID=A0A919PYZ8_9ACTN|nr:hypothetical protein Dsi01nite_110430 [Dactylosporangium siamense]